MEIAAIVAVFMMGIQGYAHYEFKSPECELSVVSMRAVEGVTINIVDCDLMVGADKTDSTTASGNIR